MNFYIYIDYIKGGNMKTTLTDIEVNLNEDKKPKDNSQPSFVSKLNEWKRKTGGLTAEEYSEFTKTLGLVRLT